MFNKIIRHYSSWQHYLGLEHLDNDAVGQYGNRLANLGDHTNCWQCGRNVLWVWRSDGDRHCPCSHIKCIMWITACEHLHSNNKQYFYAGLSQTVLMFIQYINIIKPSIHYCVLTFTKYWTTFQCVIWDKHCPFLFAHYMQSIKKYMSTRTLVNWAINQQVMCVDWISNFIHVRRPPSTEVFHSLFPYKQKLQKIGCM